MSPNQLQLFYEELDRRRLQLLERNLRPYVAAMRKQRSRRELPLLAEHRLRLDCASTHLPVHPLRDYGIEKYLRETKAALVQSGVLPEQALAWLPEVGLYFDWLNQ